MQNDRCEYCQADADHLIHVFNYPDDGFDDDVCFDCMDRVHRRHVEVKRHFDKFIAYHKSNVGKLSKKKIYTLLHNYKYINKIARFIEDVDSKYYTKNELLIAIDLNGILVDFSNYIDNLEKA